mmetsp:Transcript_19035/g.47900  ORF Transcript_19035/g.47900 Transcript_19035/m.47900 type:complete len:411 (+) Transcript_19035:66-1298(+)
MGTVTDYSPEMLESEEGAHAGYVFYQQISTMIFIGFGFLMTFLNTYAYSAVSYTFLLSLLVGLWGVLCEAFFVNCFTTTCATRIELNMLSLVSACFAGGAVMISFGGCLGKMSLFELLLMSIIEIVLYGLNIGICSSLGVEDAGGSIVIHTFGAYFGLAVCATHRSWAKTKDFQTASTVDHDLFAMIGTLVLWINWPAFNGVLTGGRQETSIVNTVLSLTGSAVVTFLLSGALQSGKFNMVHVQNATLAGGVAMGAACNMCENAGFALLIGCFSGCVSVAGYVKLTPWLTARAKLHDTCGIHNLHGMPGVIGGLASLCFLPSENLSGQALSLIITLAISIAGGLITGILLLYCGQLEELAHFKDYTFFSDGTVYSQLTTDCPPEPVTPLPMMSIRNDKGAAPSSTPVIPF